MIDYPSKTVARIDRGADQPAALAISTLPLLSPHDGAPASLDLVERDGALRPSHPLVPVRLPARLGEGVAVGESGVGVTAVGADVAVEQVGQSAFYANTDIDTDTIVQPQPLGVEFFTQLRSVDSPEQLSFRFDLPPGARVQETDGPDRGLEIVRGDDVLARVSRPTASDADGADVPLSFQIVGSDLSITVAHRSLDVAYPILVDPYISDANLIGAPSPDNGALWNWASSNGEFGPAAYCAYLGCGLYIRDLNGGWYNHLDQGYWGYRAQGDATVFGVDYNALRQDNPANTQMCTFTGILGGDGNWMPGQPQIRCEDQLNYGWIDRIDSTLSTAPHNIAIYGLEGLYDGYYPYFMGAMTSATVYVSDNKAPTTSATQTISGWTDNPNAVVAGQADDSGLGVAQATLTRDGGVVLDSRSGSGCYYGARCDPKATRSATVSQLASGVNTISLQARDPAGNDSGVKAITTVKVDRSPPAVPAVSGPAWDARTQPDDDGGESGGIFVDELYLDASATDSQVGVASLELQVDGLRLHPADLVTNPGCTAAGCPTSFNARLTVSRNDLTQGDHTITVVARDQLAGKTGVDASRHTSSRSFSLYSPGPDVKTDASASTPDDPDDGPTDTASSSQCDSSDSDFAGDTTSCMVDPSARLVTLAAAEPHVESDIESPLLVGDQLVATPTAPTDTTGTASATACPMHAPLSREVPINPGRRFGLSDQSAVARNPATGRPDFSPTFADPRAQALNVLRVRLVVPYDLVTRARAQTSSTTEACRAYQAVYSWISEAVNADRLNPPRARREPLISFEFAHRRGGNRHLPDTNNEYKPAVRAFTEQFPAVQVYTAWNEPNHKAVQPTGGSAGALRAGRYWRALNGLCENGRTCLVAAGDFLDDASLNQSYRANYFKGMGSHAQAQGWAYHPYGAIKYGPNSEQGRRLTRFLNSTMVGDRAQIWFTESGAFARQGLPDATANLNEQASDLDRFLNDPSSQIHDSRFRRFYYYSWHGDFSFDTGLVGYDDQPALDNAAPTRPVYCVYRQKTNRANMTPCP